MLKSIKLLILVLILGSSEVFASHYMGGEITWECLGNGNFRFTMKLYRECGGVTFNNSETLTVSNYPGLSSIPMNLKPGANPMDGADGPVDGKTDLSPNCWNTANEIHCYPQPASNQGAVEEWYYTSDQSYPNGVKLTGTPPGAGWIFSHTSCCRNPSTNVPNATSLSWFLRAIMYPYNSWSTFPCYDNSPTFAELPKTVICSGYPFTYNHNAFDKELDSLSFEWAPALNGNISTPVTYAAGYSYNSPLPGPAQNPLNVAATINPYNGEISYTSYTNGAFVTVTKVTAYRCGLPVAEIFREMQIVLLGCLGNNLPPSAAPPFFNPNTGMLEYVDTVYAGDVVDFDIMAVDQGRLPNGNFQTLTLEASGPDFGAGFTNPNAGCIRPPCATLTPPPKIIGQLAVGTHFHWQTDCNHLTHDVAITGIPDICGVLYNVHNFVIKIYDNFCPAPGIQIATITVVILPPPILKAPEIKCVEVLPNGDVKLNWTPPYDPHNSFTRNVNNSYLIYYSKSPKGPFTLIDSISNYNTSSKTYSGLNPCDSAFFYTRTRSGCLSIYSDSIYKIDTFSVINLNVTANSLGNVAMLEWNPIQDTLNATSSTWYKIYREFPVGIWTMIDSTQQLNYNDTAYVCSATVNYRIEISDTTGCTSVSCIDGVTLHDAYPPDLIELDSVSVDNATGKAILGWQASTTPDVVKYFIYYKDATGAWNLVDSVNIPQTSYMHLSSNPLIQPESYSIAAVDSCKKISPMSSEHKTIYLSPIVLNACADKVHLDWSAYINFVPPLGGYRINVSENGGPETLLAATSPTTLSYEHLDVVQNSTYCYNIRAFDSSNQKISTSNIQCVTIVKPNAPKYVYMRYATVEDNNKVRLGFFADTKAHISKYKILRSEDGINFETIALLTPVGNNPDVSFEDLKALVTQKSYYYKVVVVDSCNIDALTSNIGRTIYLEGYVDDYLLNYLSWNVYEDRYPLSYNVFREVEIFEPYTKIQSLVFNEVNYFDNVENYIESSGRFKYMIEAPLFDVFDTIYPFADTVYSNEIILLQSPRLYVPNAFAPGGWNSIFKPIGVFTDKGKYEFIIYDRWGRKVFETKDYNEGWDGKSNGEVVPSGVFTYSIQITDSQNKSFSKRGIVTVVK